MTNRLLALPIVALLAIGSPGITWADVFAEAERAKAAGDYGLAYSLLLPLAKEGDARAQYRLGKMFAGAHVGKRLHRTIKLKRARYWYEKSAAQNYLPGKRALGYHLMVGGIDAMRGYRILLQLAQAGDARAQSYLGYFMAIRAKEDYPKRYRIPGTAAQGLAWMHKSVNQKDTFAAYALFRYHDRYGPITDAYFWDLVFGALTKTHPLVSTPPLRDELTTKQRLDVERRAAAWLRARGVMPVHVVKTK